MLFLSSPGSLKRSDMDVDPVELVCAIEHVLLWIATDGAFFAESSES